MRHNRDCCSLTEWFISVFFRLSVMNASVPRFPPWNTTFSTAVHRRTFARSLALPTFQVAEDFALPAATASSSLRFTTALLAVEHFRLLVPRCGIACHRRLRHLWRPSALDSRRFYSLSHILTFGSSDIFLSTAHTVYSGPSSVLNIWTTLKIRDW